MRGSRRSKRSTRREQEEEEEQDEEENNDEEDAPLPPVCRLGVLGEGKHIHVCISLQAGTQRPSRDSASLCFPSSATCERRSHIEPFPFRDPSPCHVINHTI